MLGIRCVSVCGCPSENSFVCFGAKPTQRLAHEISHETWRGWRKEGPREEKKTVSRRKQKGLVDRTGRSKRWNQDREERRTEVRKTTAKTCSPTEAGLTNARKWVSIPCCFVEVSCKYTPTIAWKCTESCTKVSQTSLLRLQLTQIRFCLFIPFFQPFGCALRVRKEMCNAPVRRWETTWRCS